MADDEITIKAEPQFTIEFAGLPTVSNVPETCTYGWAVVCSHVHHEGAECFVAHDPGFEGVQVIVAMSGKRLAAYWTRPDRLYDIKIRLVVVEKASRLANWLWAGTEGHEKMSALKADLIARGARERAE